MNSQNHQYLKWLSFFHYLLGSLGFFFTIAAMIYMYILVWSSTGNQVSLLPTPHPTHNVTYHSLYIGILLGYFIQVLLLVSYSICLMASGRFLAKRKRYWFSLIVACTECIFMPFGTVLGVFTLIVLLKDSVKTLYRLNYP